MGRQCRNMQSSLGVPGTAFHELAVAHPSCVFCIPPLRSLQRLCGLRGGAALIFIGACLKLLVSTCSEITLSLVDVCLVSLSGLDVLAAMCWIVGCSSLLSCFGSHLSGTFLCRYIRLSHAMVHPTSLSSFSRASWGPNSPGGGGFMLFLLFLIVQPYQAVSATSKPRVVQASTTSTGAAQIVSPFVTAVAKPCGTHGLFNGARKRAFRRARNRVAQAGPNGHTWYRGRRCSAADLGLKRSISSFTAPLHSARARNTAKRASLPCLRLPTWPSEEGASSSFAASRQRGFLSALSLNLGGLTQHGYDELSTWLHMSAVRDQVDVICLQETWRLGSEYMLPDWFWILSGSAPVSGQGIAVLVNRKFAPDETIRFKEVQVGRLLHVFVPLQHCGGPRNLDIVCVYIPSKVSESQSTYDRRDKSWTRLDRLLDSLPRRNMLCVAGDFNTDLHLAPPFVGVSYDAAVHCARSAPVSTHAGSASTLCSQYLEARGYIQGCARSCLPG